MCTALGKIENKTHEPQRQTIVRLLADEQNRDDPLSELDSRISYWHKADMLTALTNTFASLI